MYIYICMYIFYIHNLHTYIMCKIAQQWFVKECVLSLFVCRGLCFWYLPISDWREKPRGSIALPGSGRECLWIHGTSRRIARCLSSRIALVSSSKIPKTELVWRIGGMVTIPSHGWFLTLFYPHHTNSIFLYSLFYLHHQPHQWPPKSS